MKIKSVAATSMLAVALVLGSAAPSFAGSSSLESTGTGGSAVGESSVTLAQLQEARKTQNASKVAAVIATAGPANRVSVLMNDSGQGVAAIATPASGISVFSITPVGPGCNSTSACIYPYNGYQGTGVLSISVAGNKTFAGDHATTFWVGNTGSFAAPYVTLNFASTRTFTKITRS